MYRLDLTKPDGRPLALYSSAQMPKAAFAPSPQVAPVAQTGSHLRWHPLRAEWVAYAGHRQDRTFLPPKEFNPLAPSAADAAFPTELPVGTYDIAVFDNMFPTLSAQSGPAPTIDGVLTRPADGACEVVVFTQDQESSLGRLPLANIALLLEVWGDRYRELGKRPEIQYVMPFENRGVEVGVTLHHPHGQIYAYPFVPPLAARELVEEQRYFEQHGRTLLGDFVEREVRDRLRLVYEEESAVAFVPACARYPYEVWIAPRRACASLAELTAAERLALAKCLKTVLLKYDGLWQRPFPYLMVIHQAPTDGKAHPEAHLRFEFSPAYRSEKRLKYLAGTELGAGLFANDSFPEAKARELQDVAVSL